MWYLEIILWRFGYRPKYQPETQLWSRVDTEGKPKLHVIICLSHIPFTISTCLALKNVSKTEDWRNFCVTPRHLFTSDVIKWSTLRAGHDNLSPFKTHDFRLSSWQADNQLAGRSLSHMQTLGYHGKTCLKYVIIGYTCTAIFNFFLGHFISHSLASCFNYR